MRPEKSRYDIYQYGRKVGESWAVSADKALNNYWWREVMRFDKFTQTDVRPHDFVAVRARGQAWE